MGQILFARFWIYPMQLSIFVSRCSQKPEKDYQDIAGRRESGLLCYRGLTDARRSG